MEPPFLIRDPFDLDVHPDQSISVVRGIRCDDDDAAADYARFDPDGTLRGMSILRQRRGGNTCVETVHAHEDTVYVERRVQGESVELVRFRGIGTLDPSPVIPVFHPRKWFRDVGTLDPSFIPITGDLGRFAYVQRDGRILTLRAREDPFDDDDDDQGDPEAFREPAVLRFLPDGRIDPGFRVVKLSGDPICAVEDPNGNTLVGGVFRKVGNDLAPGLARLDPDGRLDTTFRPRINRTTPPPVTVSDYAIAAFDPGKHAGFSVNAIAVDGRGRIYIGGSFRDVEGVKRPNIARLNADGSLDQSFDPGEGATGTTYPYRLPSVDRIALLPDGSLIVAGNFTRYDGTPCDGLVRVADDSEWIALDPHLAAAIRETLEHLGGALSREDLALLSDLNLAGRSICSLEGLDHAVNLRTLNLTRNRVSDLGPIKGLRLIRAASFAGNDLVLNDLSILQTLDVLKSGGAAVLVGEQNSRESSRTFTISRQLWDTRFIEGVAGEFTIQAIPGIRLSWPPQETGLVRLQNSFDLTSWRTLSGALESNEAVVWFDSPLLPDGSEYFRIQTDRRFVRPD